MQFRLPLKSPKLLKAGKYKTDLFNRNPIFSVQESSSNTDDFKKKFFVRSWEEAYAILENARFSDVNFEYINSLINSNVSSDISPYTRIKRIPRSCEINISNNDLINVKSFNPFEILKKESRKRSIFDLVSSNIKKELQKEFFSNIGLEHSSGIDSNSILGCLVSNLGVNISRVYTYSFESLGEEKILKKARSFYNLNSENCLRIKRPLRYKVKKNCLYDKLQNELNIFGAPQLMPFLTEGIEFLLLNKCKTLFSGLGGDQGISHNGRNVVNDFLNRGDLHKVYKWTDKDLFLFLKTISIRFLPWEINPIRGIKNYMITSKFLKYDVARLIRNSFTEMGRQKLYKSFAIEYSAEHDYFLPINQSIKKRISAHWISTRREMEYRLAKYYGINVIYPFLNESLISELLIKEPFEFSKRFDYIRELHLDNFKNVLPPFYKSMAIKKRDFDDSKSNRLLISQLEEDIQEFINSLNVFDPRLNKLINIEIFYINIYKLLEKKKKSPEDLFVIRNALEIISKINIWFLSLN